VSDRQGIGDSQGPNMPVLPPPPARRLTTAEAIAIAKRARKLLRKGLLTPHQAVILDCLLWACRSPATGAIIVSYTALQRLCHCARGTVAAALDALQREGLLSRVKRRMRCAWHQGGTTTRQATSCYMLHPPPHTESNRWTVSLKSDSEILYVQRPTGDLIAAQIALARSTASSSYGAAGGLIISLAVGILLGADIPVWRGIYQSVCIPPRLPGVNRSKRLIQWREPA